MKLKILIVFFFALLSLSYVSAQSDSILQNKQGTPILPQAGAWAIGLSVNPVLNYVGNMFSASGSNYFSLGLVNNGLFGKYYVTNQVAIRGRLMMNHGFTTFENKVQSDYKADAFVTDFYEMTRSFYNIYVGVEKHNNGQSRLQLSYGAEVFFSNYLHKDAYAFGNVFSDIEMSPTSTFFTESGSNQILQMSERVIKRSQVRYNAGLRAFAGIEYFILPKIALGTEIGLAYQYTLFGQSVLLYEKWDIVNSKVRETWEDNTVRRGSALNTDILNGNLYILFHF